MEPSLRAIAILKAKGGQEQALLDFTLSVLPEIKNVDGLRSVEVSQSMSDPGQLVLYYCWASPEASRRYVAGPVYAKIAPRLEALVQEHVLVMGKVVSASSGLFWRSWICPFRTRASASRGAFFRIESLKADASSKRLARISSCA